VLLRRSEGDVERARRLYCMADSSLSVPTDLPGLKEAARRIGEAIVRGEPIVVYSDFDADGVTSAALVEEALAFAGAPSVTVYFPSRFKEGYGFHASSVRELASQGPCLFITTDCGITAVEGCREATLLSSDVIVTDHHLPGGSLPAAHSILDPHTPEWAPFGLGDLTGAGVAYLLALALIREAGVEARVPERWAHDLLTLSIAGDGHPVVGLNRQWVISGLHSLRDTQRPGIAALQEVAGIIQGPGGERRPLSFDRDVTFGLVPRLNAAGRLEDARLAYRLLVERDPHEARPLALRLDQLNRERRGMEDVIMTDCLGDLGRDGETGYAFCMSRPGWHEGVIGIAASRLREAFGCPAVLAAGDGEYLRGSVRGVPGFNVVEALSRCAELLAGFGGHSGAGGFTVHRESVEALFQKFRAVSADLLKATALAIPLELDAQLALEEASEGTLRGLFGLEPFGQGNDVPLIACLDCAIEEVSVMGKDKEHLRLKLSQDGVVREFLWFRRGKEAFPIALLGRVDVAFTPYRSVYLGEERFSSLIKDIRPSWQQSGRGYEGLVGDIAAASGQGERMLVYTWSAHAAESLWTALRKAGVGASLHVKGQSEVQSHDSRLTLSGPGGVVVSTAPWELGGKWELGGRWEPGRSPGCLEGVRLFLAHAPLWESEEKKLSAFLEDTGFPITVRPELRENSLCWLSWTHPEKDSVGLVWKILKKRSEGNFLPYACLDDVRREVMCEAGFPPELPGWCEGGRLLLERALAVLLELGNLEHADTRRLPGVMLRAGGTFHLAGSPTYVEGKTVREGTLRARLCDRRDT
jgi:single-stranded-DNA-specific exonuclease